MAAPWEKYQQGPWGNYQAPVEQAAEPPLVESAEAPTRAVSPTPLGGLGETAATLATGGVAMPVAGIAGLVSAPFVGADRAAQVIQRLQDALTYRPRGFEGQQVSQAASAPFEFVADAAEYAGGEVAEATGSPAAGAGVNAIMQAAPALLARGRVGRGNSGANPVGSRPPVGKVAPAGEAAPQGKWAPRLERSPERPQAPATIDDLTQAKNAAYKRAEETGVVVARGAINRLKVELVNDLKKEGLNKTLHPKTSAALKEILDTKGQLSLSQIETLRKIANDAKGAIEPADARLGARIVERIDDFEANLADADVVSGNPAAATAFKEARALNTRLSKARTIDKLLKDAELQAGANYTMSGMENALRQQFKALAKNDRKMRQFSQAEQAAIRKVALGGPVENTLRLLGKLSPTGALPTLVGMGAIGAAGPAGIAIPAAGAASRYAATRMTIRNARAADELIRGEPPPPTPSVRRKQNALEELH